MEHNENSQDIWSDSVHDAVAAFTHQVSESSRQLADAAARFASASMQVIDDASVKADTISRKAEASVSQSMEAAGAAGAAAAEARELTASVHSALAEAAGQVKQETSSFLQEAVSQAEQAAIQSSRQVMVNLQDKLDAATRQIEAAVTASRDYAAQAAGSAHEARQAASDAGSDHSISGSVAEAAAAAAARFANEEIVSLREAVAGAERAAQEAREVALEANALAQQPAVQVPTEPTVSAGAQEVLERLEADYSLLTKLVQELHGRIASLSVQTAPVYQFMPPAQQLEADVNFGEASEPSYSDPVFNIDETVVEMPGAEEEQISPPGWDDPSVIAVDGWTAARSPAEEPTSPMPDEPAPAVEEPAASNGVSPMIGGRVLVSISPVPDFDRLLSLDGALGRMAGIGNVTLADYAREEVTFRVEVDPPTSVEDFRSRLSVSAGASIEVVANSDDGLALRLAS